MSSPQQDMGPVLYTVQEVAAIFAVSDKTVQRWVKAGKLPTIVTPGGRHRVRSDVVRELLERG